MYSKKEASMTRGLAILCMLILHLFCRIGNDVYGTPLLWVNETHPVVYYFGFFAEICVPLYTICAGYARYLMCENGKDSFKNNMNRAFKLLQNYWIVLLIFCALGLIFSNEIIPGNLFDFIKSIFLLHSYNGAWWYINTYIILLLIPSVVILLPINKIKNPCVNLILFFGIDAAWYLINKFNIIPDLNKKDSVLSFILVELFNLINVLPYYWLGALLCKYKTIDKIKVLIDKYLPSKFQNIILIVVGILIFIVNSIVHKAVLIFTVASAIFIIFNLVKKPVFVEKIFLFLGKHSTNIWLTHMFFYAILFVDLVEIAKYPLFILLFMILLCVMISYLIMGIQFFINSIANKFKC